MTYTADLMIPEMLVWNSLPSLPGTDGCAGMYGGVSNGNLFCMGGTNFPGKKPWEGGQKLWYDDIYMLDEKEKWIRLNEKLPFPLAHGVSISYKESIILIGGNNSSQHSKMVMACKWNGRVMEMTKYPDLLIPLAHMTGTLVNNLIIIAGGNSSPSSQALKKCYALDLENLQAGWLEMPAWPGRERILPVCAANNGKFYLFSGETMELNSLNEKYRYILQDAYSFIPYKSNGSWTGLWKSLSKMPKGVSAAGSPLPVLSNGSIVFLGGIDAITALNRDPSMHPGISEDILLYSPAADEWEYLGKKNVYTSRVTLPVVYWNNQWVYISGEISPGVRTSTIYSLKG